jgi:hypothetical protein
MIRIAISVFGDEGRWMDWGWCRLLLVFNDPGTCFFIVFVCDAHIFGLPKKTNCTVCKSYHSLEKRKYGKDGAGHLDDHDQVTGIVPGKARVPPPLQESQTPNSPFRFLVFAYF